MKNDKKAQKLFTELNNTLFTLRAPGGCKWDRVQTHKTLIKNLREESREVIDAIKNGDDENLCEELGDLLLQVIFHAAIAEEEGRFSIREVLDGINKKLIRRHPHVFGGAKADTPQQALALWKSVKEQEKILKAAKRSVKND